MVVTPLTHTYLEDLHCQEPKAATVSVPGLIFVCVSPPPMQVWRPARCTPTPPAAGGRRDGSTRPQTPASASTASSSVRAN